MNTTRRRFFGWIAGLFAAPGVAKKIPVCAAAPPIGTGLFGLPYHNERMFDGDGLDIPARPISVEDWRRPPFTVTPELDAALNELGAGADRGATPAKT